MIDSRLESLAMRSIHSFILRKNSIFYRLMNTKNVPFAIFEPCSSFSSQHVDLLFDSRNLKCGHSMVCFWRAALLDFYESAAASTFKKGYTRCTIIIIKDGFELQCCFVKSFCAIQVHHHLNSWLTGEFVNISELAALITICRMC